MPAWITGLAFISANLGSKVRSVPSACFGASGPGTLVKALSFAFAQILIAGINLYLLATVVNALLKPYSRARSPVGWPLWVALLAAATIVAMHRAVEIHVARTAGVALTIQQMRQTAVYTVRYDEESDRLLHEVFAP
ncbi:hypothetical protein EV644_11546 [Kribbella orskensis]|uniref:ABC transmembrane type-1 domain-containing protein n=1 Tax=Kribbella orskensis TaxID=2512216 RepID=A0ABY2BG97_9ACTN|nr:hypothetical protein EV642_11646 [Kribbella sp. VKM Ac-2500]TCO17026.1 hypothetical protein EV644_11546 [Kribbella orskensis]